MPQDRPEKEHEIDGLSEPRAHPVGGGESDAGDSDSMPITLEAEPAEDAAVPELVKRWKDGDQDAAAELFRRYQQRLLRLVESHLNEKFRSRLGADELLNSIFGSAFRVTRQGALEFRDETGFWKWLVTVALHKMFKRIAYESAAKRDPDRQVAGEFQLDSYVAERSGQLPTLAEVVETADLLETINERLDERQREVLRRTLEGFSQKQISDDLGVNDRTIRRDMTAIREVAQEVAGDVDPEWARD